jgi:hypothetical protein
VTSAKAASMALHELATYAVKHGALSNRLAELKSRGLSPTTPTFLTAGEWRTTRRCAAREGFGSVVDRAVSGVNRRRSAMRTGIALSVPRPQISNDERFFN